MAAISNLLIQGLHEKKVTFCPIQKCGTWNLCAKRLKYPFVPGILLTVIRALSARFKLR